MQKGYCIALYCFLFGLLSSGAVDVHGQTLPTYRVDQVELPGDIAGNSVNNMVQDKEGYLWFSSQDGLHRFDGFQFKSWHHDPQNPKSLSSSYIEWCLVDKNNNLWVGSYEGGVNLFDRKTETFTHFVYESNRTTSLSNNQVTCMVEDNVGNIWVGTEDGLNKLDPFTRRFTRYRHDPKDPKSLNSNSIKSLLIDHNGILWVGTGNPNESNPDAYRAGLNRYNPGNGTFNRFSIDAEFSSKNSIWALEEDSKGTLWVGTTGNGLFSFDRNTKQFTRRTIDPVNWSGKKAGDAEERVFAQVSFIHEDQHKKLWIGSFGGGLNVYDPATGKIFAFQQSLEENQKLPNKFSFRICETRDGTIFVSTGGLGKMVYKIRANTEKMQGYTLSSVPDAQINYVFQLLENKPGQILSISGDGLHAYQLNAKKYQSWPSGTEASRLRKMDVQSLYKDRSGDIWVLAINAILKYAADGSNRRELASLAKTKIRFPRDMLQTKNGSIWITTGFQGLAQYFPKNDSLAFFDLPTYPLSKPVQRFLAHNDSLKLSRGIVTTKPIEDKSGKIWLAAGFNFTQRALQINEGGAFFRFDPLTKKVTSFWPENVPRHMLSDLLLDRQGIFWLAIREAGIFKFDPKTSEFEEVSPVGTSSSTLGRVNHLLEDKEGYIWMATSSELIEYNPRLRAFSFFSRNNGLAASTLYGFTALKNGRLGLGTNNGFFIFDPVQMRKNGYPPELAFTDLSVGGKIITPGTDGILPQPLGQMNRLKLNYRSNVFSIGFSAFHYDDPLHNRIQYMLENYDLDWREVKGEQAAQYVNVPSGNYTFKIRAVNSQGIWNSKPATIPVTITPPWWRTGWALALFLVLFAAAAWFLYRWRMKVQKQTLEQRERELQQEREQLESERRMNERLQQVDKLKDQFLANTSHELRTPLQGIIGLSEALLEDENDPERKANLLMVVSSGKRLNSLVNDILDFSKLKNADIELDLRPISLHSMADVVLKNISPLVAGKPIELLNSVSIDLSAAAADENRLQQILYNLLGNAVKFTEKGYIKIDAIEQENLLVVCVEDTGSGIPAEKRDAIFQEFTQGDASTTRAFSGTGLGLTISKRLVELHGGTIWLESEVEQGSKFFFSLPKAVNEGELPVQKVEAPQSNEGKSTLRSLLDEVQKAQDDTVSTLIGQKESGMVKGVPVLKNGSSALVIDPQDSTVHILVVDDEPINQQVLKSHLSALKYDITSALNGEDALKALENGKQFDLVLLDVMMPRMSGYEVCEQIRKRFLPSELPVIMITAKNQVQDLVHGLNTGANDYITKPFTKDEFLARVKTHLNLHQIHSATGRFVPVEFIRSLGRESITEVQLGDHIEKEVTVLFSDIRDFTGLSEKMTPEENFRFVNAFHGRLGPIVQANHGFINQYLGDGIMAIFNQKPEDALKACILMQKNIRAYNLTRLTKGRSQIRTGMGMHTGPLIMGIIGDEKRMDAATISDTVNTASRIESLTKFYGANILISEASLKGIADKSPFNLRFLGKVLVKGKQHELGIYECIDGDEPEMLWYKKATLEDFSKGIDLFFAKEFAAAAEVFKEKVLRRNPRDVAAKIILAKAQNLAQTGVPEDWTGVEKMDFK